MYENQFVPTADVFCTRVNSIFKVNVQNPYVSYRAHSQPVASKTALSRLDVGPAYLEDPVSSNPTYTCTCLFF